MIWSLSKREEAALRKRDQDQIAMRKTLVDRALSLRAGKVDPATQAKARAAIDEVCSILSEGAPVTREGKTQAELQRRWEAQRAELHAQSRRGYVPQH